jgi:hypothetical protein
MNRKVTKIIAVTIAIIMAVTTFSMAVIYII